MKKPSYWNHNTAYYGMIKKNVSGCRSVLDVGCGDGALLAFLDDGTKTLTGIDPDAACIETAQRENGGESIFYIRDDFITRIFPEECRFDAVVFVASLHHMDCEAALCKAVRLLSPKGKLLIVGLAKPSSLFDYAMEAARVIPCALISRMHSMKECESMGIPVSYALPPLREVRKVTKKILPKRKMRYGLYYRYIIEWTKKDIESAPEII